MNNAFTLANVNQANSIWDIIQDAIYRRKLDNSNQWQDGYPNLDVIRKDIQQNCGYVLLGSNQQILGYVALKINDEPQYANIKGKWLSTCDFVVIHRLAVAKDQIGKGVAKQILQHVEKFVLDRQIYSIKADTNFDNQPMLHLFDKLGYVYCGQVVFRGSERMAFEKILK